MKIFKKLIQLDFKLASKACTKLDAAIAKNDSRANTSWAGLKRGSLSARAKNFFVFGYSWKMAAAERLVKLPFAAARKIDGRLLK